MPAQHGSAVSVRFWGARGSIPSPSPDTVQHGGNTSCVEIRADDQLLILDAGSGIRRFGAALDEEFGARAFEATLLISHTHWDHIQGLPFFAPAYNDRNRIHIWTPPGRRRQIERALNNMMDPIHFPVPPTALSAITGIDELPPEGKSIGHILVRVTELHHPGGCGGFRLEADGVSIAYLPDHEPYHSRVLPTQPSAAQQRSEARLIEFVRGCDVLILDTQYDETEYPARMGWGHGCVIDSVALALAAEVRTLVLFHHDPSHSDAKLAEILSRAQELAAEAGSALKVRAAHEGDVLRPAASRPLPNRTVLSTGR